MTGISEWWQALLEASADESTAIHDAFQQLENAGLTNRVTVQRYLCRKGNCKLAVAIRVDDRIIVRTRDYKLAPGTNAARSVASARARRTLDGDRHWPGSTVDVTGIAGPGAEIGIEMTCRHGLRVMLANQIVSDAGDKRPGHPGPPTLI